MTPWLNGYEHECERCGEVTEPTRHYSNKKYCTQACRMKASTGRVQKRRETEPEYRARKNGRNRASRRRTKETPFVPGERKCDWCLTPFTAKQRQNRFCSYDCGLNWHARKNGTLLQFTDPEKYSEYRERLNAGHKRYRERMRAEGICVACGKPSYRVGVLRCLTCVEEATVRRS